MRLYLIRHAIAVPRGTPGVPDEERPLTPRGERRFRRAARGLARVAPRPDALLTSPLPRAARTARLVARAWRRLEPTVLPALAPGRARDVVAVLGRYPADATIALVGHEPDLSTLLASLLGARGGGTVTLRKGGVARVDLERPPGPPGHLVWFLPPRILRRLGRR